MTRYFFNIRNGVTFTEDFEGSQFPDNDTAMRDALVMAREFAIDDLKQLEAIADRIIEICDEAGSTVGTLRVRDILGSVPVSCVA